MAIIEMKRQFSFPWSLKSFVCPPFLTVHFFVIVKARIQIGSSHLVLSCVTRFTSFVYKFPVIVEIKHKIIALFWDHTKGKIAQKRISTLVVTSRRNLSSKFKIAGCDNIVILCSEIPGKKTSFLSTTQRKFEKKKCLVILSMYLV